MIRLELAYPGSHFFKGDSLKYLQVITAHGLIMVFFVVVPIIFGFLANFFIPFHIGSKDVAFPRLNSIGFWIQPAGYFLLAKTTFLRPLTHNIKDYKQNFESYISNSNYSNSNIFLYKKVVLYKGFNDLQPQRNLSEPFLGVYKTKINEQNTKELTGSSFINSNSTFKQTIDTTKEVIDYTNVGIQNNKTYPISGRDFILKYENVPNKWAYFYGLRGNFLNKFKGVVTDNNFLDTKFVTCPSAGQVLSG